MLVRPTPTDEEAAAIAAALTVLIGGGTASEQSAPVSTDWRFSGRWWSSPRFGTRRTA